MTVSQAMPSQQPMHNSQHNFQPVEDVSRASSTTVREMESYHPSSAVTTSAEKQLPPPPPPRDSCQPGQPYYSTSCEQQQSPEIIEAVPRDNVVMPEEYRTLTSSTSSGNMNHCATTSREDELRRSIKLKESSLI